VAWKYAKAELRPPTPAEIPKAIVSITGLIGAFGRGSWRRLTVKVRTDASRQKDFFLLLIFVFNSQEAWLNTLVAAEISFWFFVGEVVGRRHLLGYQPGYGYKGH
jgi:F-type H+-transporting ATPase subunit g